MLTFLYLIFTLSALILVAMILFRPSESSGLGGAFGGMGSDTVLGVRATQVIDKVIGIAAAVFILIAIWIGAELKNEKEHAGGSDTTHSPSN